MQNGGTVNMDAPSKRATLRKGVDAAAYPLPFKHGGKIHIKPENRGKFNATKAKTGKSTEELTHSSNPVTKKRAVFAQNAAKWKHADGGKLGVVSTFNAPFKAKFTPVTAFSRGGRTKFSGPDDPKGTSSSPVGLGWELTGSKPDRDTYRNKDYAPLMANKAAGFSDMGEFTREGYKTAARPTGWNPKLETILNEGFNDPKVSSLKFGRFSGQVDNPFLKEGIYEQTHLRPVNTPVAAAAAVARKPSMFGLPAGTVYGQEIEGLTKRSGGGTINRSPSIMPSQPPDMNSALLKATRKLSDGGSVRPSSDQELNPASASSGMNGVPPGGIQPPVLMYNTYASGLNEAVVAALKRVTPLPQAAKGMKLFRKKGNGSFGDKTASPAFGTKTGLTIKKK